PDPAISTGYGQSMIDRGQHELGGAPFTDIMALTDAVVARDDIDAERTAFAGGSYGGYMANWVAGHTGDRFRCIVTHASLWDTAHRGLGPADARAEPALQPQGLRRRHRGADAVHTRRQGLPGPDRPGTCPLVRPARVLEDPA